MQNSVISTRITSLQGSHTSPVIFCMQISLNSTSITTLYGFQPSSVVLCIQNGDFRTRITSLYGSQTWPVIFCMQSACLASESLVSMGPRPHRWFWHAKQRLLDLNYNSLWVPDLTCDFVHAISVPSIRITSLYGSQTSSVVLACKTETFGPELQFAMGLRPQLSFGVCKTAWLALE